MLLMCGKLMRAAIEWMRCNYDDHHRYAWDCCLDARWTYCLHGAALGQVASQKVSSKVVYKKHLL